MHRSINNLLLLLLLFAGVGCGNKSASPGNAAKADSAAVGSMVDLDQRRMPVFLKAGGPMLLEFGGKRCISCANMRKELEKLQAAMPSLRIGFVYWEDSPELFEEWKIGLIPAQIILDADGKETTRHQGIWEMKEMKRALAGM